MATISELKEQLERSKNEVERAQLVDMIKKLEAEQNKPEELKKEVVPIRNATPVIDRTTSNRRRVRGNVMVNDNMLIM